MTAPAYEQILFDVHADVAVLTLNRPKRLNAWTEVMSGELLDAIKRCNEDAAIGAIVVTGAGRGFCAGADIEQSFKARLDGEERGTSGNWVRTIRASKPVIAAVNGPSVGVGATMLLPMDVIVASEQARFAMAFVKMGLAPELASSHFLVQRVGFGRASEMCLSGRLYSGAEAFEMGLADRLVVPEDLLDAALEIAGGIAANPAPQLRWIKQLLTENGAETDLDAVQRREREALQRCFASAEHKEAVSAFLQKRKPSFGRA